MPSGRLRQAVNKYNNAGKIVATFDSFNEAYQMEGLGFYRLKDAVRNGTVLNGHLYGYVGCKVPVYTEENESYELRETEPWEKNGLFDVKGWAKVCF